MTVRAFAESRGITPTTMYWWRSRLHQKSPMAELVPVAVVDRDVGVEDRCERRAQFELIFDSALTLRIPADFDEHELRRLIRAVRC